MEVMSEKYNLRDWMKVTQPYQKPSVWKSVIQIVNSFLPFVALWGLAYFALQVSFWLMLPVAFVAALFVVRIFIIQHDCGHGSFLKNQKAQDEIGFICSIVSLTPYEQWKQSHAMHHAHSGDLAHRDLGEIDTLTVDEYFHLSKLQRIWYRIYRNPLVLFLISPFVLFVILHRFPSPKLVKKQKKLVWSSIHTNLAILAVAIWVSTIVGWKAFLLIQLPITYFASCLGVWLFYVQHQFEDGYFFYKPEWNLVQSAIHGSSYFKLPKILQWFSGNIGFHHIHHLSPRVPNYELERCHKENPIFEKEITTLTLGNCWETMKLRFWDEDRKKLVSPKELAVSYRPRLESIQNALKNLKKRKEALSAEVSELRKKFREHREKTHSSDHSVKLHLIENQLKTINKMIRRRKIKKKENLQQFEQEIEGIKELIRKYFPRFALDKL